MARPVADWDSYFLGLACYVAIRSKDEQTQNGAVIVDEHHRILGLGYNGFPPGIDDSALPAGRPGKYPYMSHAEANALSNMLVDSRLYHCTLYCTMYPCEDCAKRIIMHGINKVVYLEKRINEHSQLMFKMAKIDCVHFDKPFTRVLADFTRVVEERQTNASTPEGHSGLTGG